MHFGSPELNETTVAAQILHKNNIIMFCTCSKEGGAMIETKNDYFIGAYT